MINYADFGLKPGVFKILPTDEAVKHWAGMPETKKKLADIMRSVRFDDVGQSEFVIMCSAWGAGKTHALRYFAREVSEKQDGYAFFVGEILHGHKTTFLGLFQHMIKKHKKMLPDLVRHVRDAVEKERIRARSAGKYPDMNDTDFLTKVIEDAVEKDDSADLVSKFVDFTDEDVNDNNKIVEVLIDKTVVGDDYSAASMLATLIGVMTSPIGDQKSRYKAVYVFLDEMESTLSLKAADHFSFFGALRQLINGTADSYCGILLSFTAQTAELEVQVEPFLWERMTRPVLEFESLDDEGAKQFAEDYLRANRRDGESPLQKFFPFSEGSMSFIIERSSQIVPRQMLRDMARVIERSVLDEKVSPGEEIPRAIAEDILNEVGL